MLQQINFKVRRLEPISLEGKNDLLVGTVLQLNGYDDPRFVIVKNLGVNATFQDYGARYMTVNLKNYHQGSHDAFSLEFLKDKISNRIQTYITDETMPAEDVNRIWKLSEEKRQDKEHAQAQAENIFQEKVKEGKELFRKYIPESAKALIVAYHEVDKCDLMTDCFATSRGNPVILGYSTHTRDLFLEMRKVADRIPETAHLKNAPKSAEHREKYSMGAGYYLKEGSRYNTGWMIQKERKWRDKWQDDFYASIAEKCVFTIESK